MWSKTGKLKVAHSRGKRVMASVLSKFYLESLSWGSLFGKNGNDINQGAFLSLIIESVNRDYRIKKPLVRFESGV